MRGLWILVALCALPVATGVSQRAGKPTRPARRIATVRLAAAAPVAAPVTPVAPPPMMAPAPAPMAAVAQAAAHKGLLFKRTAYNFMSLAHTEELVDEILIRLASALEAVDLAC